MTQIHLGTHPTDSTFIHGEGRIELFNSKDGYCSDLGLWKRPYQETPPELITGWCLCEPGVLCCLASQERPGLSAPLHICSRQSRRVV